MRLHHIVLASAALLTAPAFAQESQASVTVKTDGMPLHVAARVKQKAAQGITALRQYVWISRGVNQLDLRSIVREKQN
jgi:hypothetical protein